MQQDGIDFGRSLVDGCFSHSRLLLYPRPPSRRFYFAGRRSLWLLSPLPSGVQVERILQINELQTVTKEVVEAARDNLVIGQA